MHFENLIMHILKYCWDRNSFHIFWRFGGVSGILWSSYLWLLTQQDPTSLLTCSLCSWEPGQSQGGNHPPKAVPVSSWYHEAAWVVPPLHRPHPGCWEASLGSQGHWEWQLHLLLSLSRSLVVSPLLWRSWSFTFQQSCLNNSLQPRQLWDSMETVCPTFHMSSVHEGPLLVAM